jgi:hypothetical protein
MKLGALLIVLAIASCGQSPEKANAPANEATTEAVNPFDLHIEIGRYGVMLRQVHDLTAARPGVGEADPASLRELGRALRESVWEYNLARSRLCAKGLFVEASCGPAYEPVWISESTNVEPTLAEVQARSFALGEEVMGLWNTVCEDAAGRAGPDEPVCAIE